MIQWFKQMLSADTDVSSKRFISICGLFTLIGVVVASLFGLNVPEPIIYALVSIILGASAMTLVQNTTKNS